MAAATRTGFGHEHDAFVRAVPVKHATVDDEYVTYYDVGPRSVTGAETSSRLEGDETTPPLICIGGLAESAACFFRQLLSLGSLGYRVVALSLPPRQTFPGLAAVVIGLCAHLGIDRAVLVGSGLGGFVAQVVTQECPDLAAGLVLINAFVDLAHFASDLSCVPLIGFMPDVIIRRKLLSRLPSGLVAPEVADSIDFMVEQVEQLPRNAIISRCRALASHYDLDGPVPLDEDHILIIDALDDVAVPPKARAEVVKFYPNARVAELKTGSNFPHLAVALDVHMHMQVFFRACGWAPANSEPDEPEPADHPSNSEPLPDASSMPFPTATLPSWSSASAAPAPVVFDSFSGGFDEADDEDAADFF
ncbi:maspardin [Thecamonas trahens ATCC 50062]|uniref:Maspardin n=1 Tax=Thecamonas trahens ATCC 50062 TaxID=461836 RepID=A0A0L0DH44_THETB|nr:maspardin [Thecamonas trahens ATCC 50062]KNC51461.1 maspardin [Thecamonas trahens ATCC 50062]|eukprot:XP_013756123.1 maspardin [Thecamonas trahens ATCC 50062]